MMVDTPDKRLAELLHVRREAIVEGAVGRVVEGRPLTAGEARKGLRAIGSQLRRGAERSALLGLRGEPVESARLVAALVAAAVPLLLRESDAADLLPRLVEIAIGAGLAAGERAAQAREEQRDLMELKTSYLRLTMHELRRPVAMMRGYLEMIEEGGFGPMPAALQQPLEQIEAGNQEMLRLLHGLSLVARLEDRGAILERRRTSLARLIEETLRLVEAEARIKRVAVVGRLEPDLIAEVDADRVAIALVNLISNAVKYGPEGSTVQVCLERKGPAAIIEVHDEGPGIPAHDLAHIFEQYYRSEESRREGIPGMGLGLFIVRQIVELHGGQVTVESLPGKGTTFRMSLPI
jgi:signal transduction histidine kinase